MNIKYRVTSLLVAQMLVKMAKEKQLKIWGHEFNNQNYPYFAFCNNYVLGENWAGIVGRDSGVADKSKEVTFEKMVAEIENYKPIVTKKVSLNNDYSAEISSKSNLVKVGCLQIPIDNVRAVVKTWEELNIEKS